MQVEDRPAFHGRRVLVVDADENVRSAAHNLMERYGCVVETAHDGAEAMCMVRGMTDGEYDVIISDIRLPDMTGYEFMLKLQEVMGTPPLVLMTGFGWDPGHSLVKARQAGLQAVLYKPFRLDQLLGAVEQVINAPRPRGASVDQSRNHGSSSCCCWPSWVTPSFGSAWSTGSIPWASGVGSFTFSRWPASSWRE